jgi:hypothetical protein
MSGSGAPEGGPGCGVASNKFGAGNAGNESLLEVIVCGDDNSEEAFPGAPPGGDGKLKLSSVGVNPK